MSFYNMIHGVTQATFYILPMLGKHPNEYPRFRDCFVKDEEHPQYDDHIQIYTRVGGDNREEYREQINELRTMEGYVTDYDDSFDSTYATFVFMVPDKFKEDYDKIFSGRTKEVSTEYKDMLYRVYPKLKEKIDQIFAV